MVSAPLEVLTEICEHYMPSCFGQNPKDLECYLFKAKWENTEETSWQRAGQGSIDLDGFGNL